MLISYWALRPSGKIMPADDRPFLKRIMPLVFVCAMVEAIGWPWCLFLSPDYLKIAASNTFGTAGLSFYLVFCFCFSEPTCIAAQLTKKEKWQLFLLGVFQIVVCYLALQIPLVIRFFNITKPYPPAQFCGRNFSDSFIVRPWRNI